MQEERLLELMPGLSNNEKVKFLLTFKLNKLILNTPTGELRNELSEIGILVSLLTTKEEVLKESKELVDYNFDNPEYIWRKIKNKCK